MNFFCAPWLDLNKIRFVDQNGSDLSQEVKIGGLGLVKAKMNK